MAVGGTDDEGPTYRRPLPPEDRVWRHPSEVAEHRRRGRRRRVRRTMGLGVAGATAAAGLYWLATEPAADLRIESDLASLLPDTSTTTLVVRSWADEVASLARADTVTIRSDRGTETLARALVIGAEGFVITSGRALGDQRDVLVFWADQVEPATLVGYDETTDVSVLLVSGDLPAAAAPDSVSVAEGEMISLVNPEGASESRRIAQPISTSQSNDGHQLIGVVELEGELGTLPPGTPAVDGDGAVVGIATSTAEDAPAAVMPIELARGVAEEIILHGAATHPRIGVTARDLVEADDVASATGAYVAAVVEDGPAAIGGMETGDVVVAVASTPVESMAEMISALRAHEPGQVIQITVERGEHHVDCTVELDSNLDVE